MHRKSKILLLIVLLGIGALLSVYKLTESPPTWYDEGIYNQIAINTSLHGAQGIQVAPSTFVSSGFVTGGYPFFLPVAWSVKMFGIGILQVRMVMVLFLIAMLVVAFYLIREIFGIRNSLISLLLLVTFPVLYGNGKNVLGEVPGLFYLFCFLIFVYQIEKRKFEGLTFYILAGLTGGLCLATKPIFFLLGGAVIIAVFIHRRNIVFKWKHLLLGLIAFIVPMALWFKMQFLSTDSASSILHYYANPYGLTDIKSTIISNFFRFFHEASPMYFLFLELMWIVSYAIRFLKKKSISLVESIAFIFSILVSLAYLRTAGWYRYFFVAEIMAIAFVPMNIATILENINKKKFFVWIVTLLCLVQTYQLFFTSWVATHYRSTISADMHEVLSKYSKKTTFFIYNVPAVTIFLPNQLYYQYMEPTDTLNFGIEQISVLQAGIPDVLITTSKQWDKISSQFKKYQISQRIDDYVILNHTL